jgi:hypothetical protein
LARGTSAETETKISWKNFIRDSSDAALAHCQVQQFPRPPEIGLTGCASALTMATYHATGVRIREFPIRIEKLMAGLSKRKIA